VFGLKHWVESVVKPTFVMFAPSSLSRQRPTSAGVNCIVKVPWRSAITSRGFVQAKREEWREYITHVTQWKLDNYLVRY
jgi:hypothetical protein